MTTSDDLFYKQNNFKMEKEINRLKDMRDWANDRLEHIYRWNPRCPHCNKRFIVFDYNPKIEYVGDTPIAVSAQCPYGHNFRFTDKKLINCFINIKRIYPNAGLEYQMTPEGVSRFSELINELDFGYMD